MERTVKHQKVMVILGTRPEAVKVAPVIQELDRFRDELDQCVVTTAQHRSMLDQVLEIFQITPAHDLNIMQPVQSLAEISVRALIGLDRVMQIERPDLVLVQGDTTTAFIGGLCAFYRQIPVGHIEAGLRTRDRYDPYPEEINRHLLGVLADLCFAPTQTAREALRAEGVPDNQILVTGNTVIDALLIAANRPHSFTLPSLRALDLTSPNRTLLVTTHRRENLGAPMAAVCQALRDLLKARPALQLVFPVHLNPQVRETVYASLGNVDRAHLIEPLDYLDFVHLMKRVDLIITDSGGIQEEAPALGIPVLVARATTERPEAIEAGTARLVGTTRAEIARSVAELLDEPDAYRAMKRSINPFGDGSAARRIVHGIRHRFGLVADGPEPFHVRPAHPSASLAATDPTNQSNLASMVSGGARS